MHLSRDTWQQIKAGYAAGIGLREIARKMNVPDGTVLARAKREEWTQQIAAAKIARQPQLAKEIVKARAINAITPMQSIAAVMQERGERYRERMADVSDKVAGHLESLDADEILLRSAPRFPPRARGMRRTNLTVRAKHRDGAAEKTAGRLNALAEAISRISFLRAPSEG
jgi:hypothetical protein